MAKNNDRTAVLTIRIPEELRFKLKLAATLEERSVNDIANEVLGFWLDEWERDRPWTRSDPPAQDPPPDSSPRSS
jgi:hypothetical protein